MTKECHAKQIVGPVVHQPVAKQKCDACHDQEEETLHKFEFIDEGAELCYACHKSVTKKRKFTHKPLKDKDKKKQCLRCHSPHSTKAKKLIKAKSRTAQCYECHKKMVNDKLYHKAMVVKSSKVKKSKDGKSIVIKSTDVKTCTGCHNPHASDSAKFLHAAPLKLCLGCHDKVKTGAEAAKYVHSPLVAGCIACHDPHKPETGKGLKKRGASLCMSCHEHFNPQVSFMSKYHPRLLDENGCHRCHSPHFSSRKFHLIKPPRTLCLNCHTKDIKTRSGRKIIGVKPELAKEMRLHGPLATEDCGKCHQPHGNDKFSFLRKSYPRTFYSPYKPEIYALCFGCHNKSLAANSRTPTATKFRNGNVNLHYIHVNKPDKGRTCRACHANHATRNPHMLTDSTSFGTWSIPIKYKESKNGGTCVSGCHWSMSYDRENPVKLRPTTKPASQPADKRATSKPHSPKKLEKPTTRPAPIRLEDLKKPVAAPTTQKAEE